MSNDFFDPHYRETAKRALEFGLRAWRKVYSVIYGLGMQRFRTSNNLSGGVESKDTLLAGDQRRRLLTKANYSSRAALNIGLQDSRGSDLPAQNLWSRLEDVFAPHWWKFSDAASQFPTTWNSVYPMTNKKEELLQTWEDLTTQVALTQKPLTIYRVDRETMQMIREEII